MSPDRSERTRRARSDLALPLLVAATVAGGLWLAAPKAIDSAGLLVDQNDPVRLADRAVDKALTPEVARREIEAALAAGDAELAASFVELAQSRAIALDPGLVATVTEANTAAAGAVRTAQNFGRGLVTGEPEDGAGLAGTLLGDLFVFGDIRDAVREGGRLATGAEADELVLGLACVGLAVTAGTYVSLGVAAPARAGVSVVKAAWKTGRMGAGLAVWTARSLRGVVDLAAARRAVSGTALLQPTAAARGLKAAVKLEKAEPLVDLVRDAGKIQAKAGTRAALDGLKLADGPKDVARLAKVAEKNGGKTRAILKLGGRAALVLTTGAMTLFNWSVSALLSLIWALALVKSLTERTTRRVLAFGKWRRARRAARAARATVAQSLPQAASQPA
ncbi:hypothetical protein PQJ75_12820 [Rhodoplanes sp. TEM]|uniref:hypothetical protein n=1 Tax=Rhodoplanes TaxID=29407 RepID=UPI00235058E4|nr:MULTISPECIES: hypothetical protein [Rhodoplanes]MDC7984614.1 hypothetical protein [Rhodoplanes sp. TEM]MDQ0355577.1 hypothetical protein [Rhodoplanes tepidamans]